MERIEGCLLGLGVRSGGWFESSWAETSKEWTCKLRHLVSQTALRTPCITRRSELAVVSCRWNCPSKYTQTIKLSTVLIDLDFVCSVDNGTLTGLYRHDRSGRLRVRSTVGQLATLLWPCCSRLAAVCWDQHAGTMQSKSMDGSLHSVSPASALNRRPIQVLTARLIDAASSYPCQTPSTLMPEGLLAAITQRAAAPNVVKQATI